MLDKITKIAGLVTLLLIVISLFDLNSYYSYFGIPINDYLTTSEILLSFSQIQSTSYPNFIIYTIVFLITIYISNTQSKAITAIENEKTELIEGSDKTKTSLKFGVLLLKNFGALIPLGVLYYFTYNLALKNLSHYESSRVTISVGIIWLFFFILIKTIVYFVLEVKDIFYFRKEYRWYIDIVIIAISLLITLAHKNHIKYNLNMHGYAEFNVTCHWENDEESLKSSDVVIFLGLTDKYVFFYNRKNKMAIIRSISNLKEITLTQQEMEFHKRNRK